jgi:hypothetical protein
MQKPKRTQLFVWVSVISGVVLAVAGTVLGISATTVPDVLQGGFDERVSVWVDQADVRVDVSWSVDPSGTVSIYVGSPVVDAESPPPAFTAFIILTCDSRLVDPQVDPDVTLETREFGDEELCRTPTVFSTDLATQLLEVTVGGPNATVITGRTVADWTATGGGRRVARTPQIMLGRFDLFADELASYRLEAPAEGSILGVALDASPTETIDIFVPEGDENAIVRTSAAIYDFGATTGPVVIGSVTWSETGADAVLPSTFVRWNDSSGTASAQLSLLLSGAFLGVAASFLIEFLFDQVRARERATAGGRVPSVQPPSRRRPQQDFRVRTHAMRRPLAGERRRRE